RRGMTEREQRLGAPEGAPRFGLPVIGLEPSEAVDRGGFRDAMAGLFPELDPALAWLPVHPWQLRHELPRLGLERPVRHLESAPMRPSMSLRTLLPDRFGDFPHFKTALAVRLTGAVRIVSVQAAANGPRLTELLSHPRFRSSTLTVLGEPASLHWRRDDPDEAKRVSAVLRQNPEGLSRRGDLLMPAAALIEGSGGGPLVAEVVGSGDPAAWLRDYAGALLRPLLRLMSEEDIALEGHLQNIVVRLRAGETPHFFYRDFGGVRLYPPRLQPRIDGPLDFAPGSATVTDREEELWSKVCYPALQNHLGELIRALTLHFEVPEAELWRPVRELLETHLTRPEERAWFLAPAWRLKAMTRMRIERRVTEYRYGEVRNPLWRG
ncbi:MAG: IucA/IucC family C-terminal-domain containing protein, partial [Acidobacteriota bacterium]